MSGVRGREGEGFASALAPVGGSARSGGSVRRLARRYALALSPARGVRAASRV